MMSDVCTDFLRRRVVKEVWPKLVRLLQQLLPGSVSGVPLYHQTLECKLLRTILSVVANLAVKVHAY